MSSNIWLTVLFLSFIIVPFSFSSLEFTFPLRSETHIKAEYTIQEPVPCKQHPHENTKKCSVSVFHLEHNMFNIPAISCQQITTIITATFYFLENLNSNQCRQTYEEVKHSFSHTKQTLLRISLA